MGFSRARRETKEGKLYRALPPLESAELPRRSARSRRSGVDPDAFTDRFSSAYLVALAAAAIRDLAVLRERAWKSEKKLPTLSLQTEVRFASAGKQKEFAEELTRELARLVSRYHDEQAPGGRRFKLLLGAYPALTKKEVER